MAYLVSVEPHGNILRVKVRERMSMKTYEHIMPFIDSAIEQFHAVRILFNLIQYEGREPEAAFEDAKLSLPHWAEVERVAFIGDKQLEPRMPAFSVPFTSAIFRFFYPDQVTDAEQWIHEGIE